MSVSSATNPSNVLFAGSRKGGTAITVGCYAEMLKKRNRVGIANLIRLRFGERFLDPALHSRERHGFSILAICCLTVEALESFRRGWKKSSGHPGGGAGVFRDFFNLHDEFKEMRPFAEEFYQHVRCGILHQAETTGGWIIDRSSRLLSKESGTYRLSAYEFGKRLTSVLNQYVDGLVEADWKDPSWKKARRKLQSICRNCGFPEAEVVKLQ